MLWKLSPGFRRGSLHSRHAMSRRQILCVLWHLIEATLPWTLMCASHVLCRHADAILHLQDLS